VSSKHEPNAPLHDTTVAHELSQSRSRTPLPNVAYSVGGVAIVAGGNIIGGIGVSGAPGGNFDDECARAAIAKIQDRMT
jgi:uncharacterized protein GlcG (DUF336 family)